MSINKIPLIIVQNVKEIASGEKPAGRFTRLLTLLVQNEETMI
jgi:hypothetical protein